MLEILVIIHAFFGGVALLAGAIALFVKKGNSIHKKSGKIFYYSMLISTLLSLAVAATPQKWNPFLFSIGIFSVYFIISGYRSLHYKRKNVNLFKDRLLAGLIISIGILMIILPIIFSNRINIILLVFGVLSIFFGVRDFLYFKKPKELQKKWLKLHIIKITSGYISAVSAFFVVNQFLPVLYNWFVPGVIGGMYITFWVLKINKKKNNEV